MFHRIASYRNRPVFSSLLPGIVAVTVLAVCSIILTRMPWLQPYGISALTLAIMIGLFLANTIYPRFARYLDPGTDFAKGRLLRLAVMLYGLKISFQQIAEVGSHGVLLGSLMMMLTFTLTLFLGTRVFKLDRHTAILIGAGSSICGAAAILATESVIRARSSQVSVAVATVVIFGTAAMLIYPLMYSWLGLSPWQFGIYAGSTIHEVAQVVVVGHSAGELAEASAIIEKMSRVMLLAPFLMVLSLRESRRNEDGVPDRITIPWFAVLFVIDSAVNSLHWLPSSVVRILISIDNVLLTMAMAALGIRTHLSAVRQAGLKPMLLACCVFVFLIVGGYLLNLLLVNPDPLV